MPVFENRVTFEVVRGIKVFLNMEAGVTRDGAVESKPGPGATRTSAPSSEQGIARTRKLKQAGQLIARKGRALKVRARRLGGEEAGIRPENIVWIFGAARTGSTWLAALMGELERYTVWREPLVGALFGNLYYDRAKHRIGKTGEHYILSDGYRDSWLGSMRAFVLKEATERFPQAAGPGNYLVVKEPNGSAGAPLLMDALPESRMILLVRDPRDVVASSMDAKRTGGWQYENRRKWKAESRVDKDPDAFVRSQAEAYLHRIGLAQQAYEAHNGCKVLVHYEELRANTLSTMRHIYSALELPVDERELVRAIEKHSWENIPEEKKGEGKFYRKAMPGSWREDLTPKQAEMVESITAPLLEEFYSDSTP